MMGNEINDAIRALAHNERYSKSQRINALASIASIVANELTQLAIAREQRDGTLQLARVISTAAEGIRE